MCYYYFENKKVYYNELGEGTPLLLLHGNTASSKMFSEIAEEYKKDFKVILIDFLGHGQSDRLKRFPADLWFYEAQQVIAFLREKNYSNVNIIGSSGGALVAINVALEAPDLVSKVIADSFEGEYPLESFTATARADRELSKQDENTKMFYACMHGSDWEQVVDNDTDAVIRHSNEIGVFFHKPLHFLTADILLTGSKADEFISAISPDYFENVYGAMLKKFKHGEIHLSPKGGHPAMLTNSKDFYELSLDFFRG
ncbi:MAG: alpha/beta hydrolase [Oscillospiraceae bacterium]|jgi:pimeloyl-ACP methyl ester carboxylesterase|nr:alpha/beta hydrolase [Oscillospiraceae bacterium]